MFPKLLNLSWLPTSKFSFHGEFPTLTFWQLKPNSAWRSLTLLDEAPPITSPTAKLGLPCPGTNCQGMKPGRAKVIPELWLVQILGCCHWTGWVSALPSPLWCGGQKCSLKKSHTLTDTSDRGRPILLSLYTPNCVCNALWWDSAGKTVDFTSAKGLWESRGFTRLKGTWLSF